jgi:hypothetical protein
VLREGYEGRGPRDRESSLREALCQRGGEKLSVAHDGEAVRESFSERTIMGDHDGGHTPWNIAVRLRANFDGWQPCDDWVCRSSVRRSAWLLKFIMITTTLTLNI